MKGERIEPIAVDAIVVGVLAIAIGTAGLLVGAAVLLAVLRKDA